MLFSGPREIRTLDLLNAIETRSQLRYGPLLTLFFCFPWRSQFPGEGTSCAMGPCLLYSFVFHGAPNSPGRGLRALWALAYSILLFSIALPIPRGGDFVRYGRLLTLFFCFPWRSQFPGEGTSCAIGLQQNFSNGPGGIRTLDLFSAIEARSQLRYRPVLHPDFKNKHSNGLRQECQAFFYQRTGKTYS